MGVDGGRSVAAVAVGGRGGSIVGRGGGGSVVGGGGIVGGGSDHRGHGGGVRRRNHGEGTSVLKMTVPGHMGLETVVIGGVVDDALGAVSLDQAVAALDHVSVARLLLGLVVTGVAIGDSVLEGVVGGRLETKSNVKMVTRAKVRGQSTHVVIVRGLRGGEVAGLGSHQARGQDTQGGHLEILNFFIRIIIKYLM